MVYFVYYVLLSLIRAFFLVLVDQHTVLVQFILHRSIHHNFFLRLASLLSIFLPPIQSHAKVFLCYIVFFFAVNFRFMIMNHGTRLYVLLSMFYCFAACKFAHLKRCIQLFYARMWISFDNICVQWENRIGWWLTKVNTLGALCAIPEKGTELQQNSKTSFSINTNLWVVI